MEKLLWSPSKSRVENSNMNAFMQRVNKKYGLELNDYRSLYEWSVNNIPEFWDEFWNYAGIKASKPYDKVVDDLKKFPGAQWFPGAELNYSENLLRFSDNDRPALIFRGENIVRRVITHREAKSTAIRLAIALQKEGVTTEDAVSAYMPNMPETIIGMLAVSAVGATWCSCATDIAPGAAVDRLGQVSPKVIITADKYYYKGKCFNVLKNASEIADMIPTVEWIVVCPYDGIGSGEALPNDKMVWLSDYIKDSDEKDFSFVQVSASHPAVVMFSSGTTGKPKCMVQSVAGLLINQLKELVLHHDLRSDDTMLYITTCSWMMWNWLASAIGVGSTIVLYDGNPAYPDTAAIWKILEEEKVTVFGLSASYVHSLVAQGFIAKDHADMSALRCISQTGSALSPEGFDYIYNSVKADLHFSSIAGGTDINGCFCIGNPLSPVYANMLQSPGLGMKINCYDENGKPVRDVQGELVCEAPAPSMPLYFWNDPDGKRYHSAYFDVFPGVWRHGDYVLFHSDTGGVTFYGRSDSVLKPSGVRIGTAEIYNQVEKLPEVIDSLAIGQNYHGDQRIVLFVVLRDGLVLDERISKDIKTILRTNASPRHVPAVIIQAPALPLTLNGKKVESAVTNIVNGRAVTNRDALLNPEILDFYTSILPQLA